MSDLPTNPSESFKRRNPQLYQQVGIVIGDKDAQLYKQIKQSLASKEKLFLTYAKPHSFSFGLQSAEPQCDEAAALGPTNASQVPLLGKITVRITGWRLRPLDPDNFAGGTKDLIDGLKHAGLLPGDSWQQIVLITEQVKIAHKKDEHTEILIDYP